METVTKTSVTEAAATVKGFANKLEAYFAGSGPKPSEKILTACQVLVECGYTDTDLMKLIETETGRP